MHIRGNFLNGYSDKKGYYDGKCGMCEHYQLDKITRFGCMCDVRTRKGLAFDDTCSRQRNDRKRTSKDIKKAMEKIRDYTPEVYYVATAVRDILGSEASKVCFVLIKQYRDQRVQNELRFFGNLVSYDIYGRLVAEAIRKDKRAKEICTIILNSLLKPTCRLILNDELDRAIAFYRYGIERLCELYRIPNIREYHEELIQDLDDTGMSLLRTLM